VKSHHHQFFPNGQFFDFLKIDFLIFYKLKCDGTNFHEILHFLVLVLREFFYDFPSKGSFFLKVYTFKHIFSILKKLFF